MTAGDIATDYNNFDPGPEARVRGAGGSARKHVRQRHDAERHERVVRAAAELELHLRLAERRCGGRAAELEQHDEDS